MLEPTSPAAGHFRQLRDQLHQCPGSLKQVSCVFWGDFNAGLELVRMYVVQQSAQLPPLWQPLQRKAAKELKSVQEPGASALRGLLLL